MLASSQVAKSCKIELKKSFFPMEKQRRALILVMWSCHAGEEGEREGSLESMLRIRVSSEYAKSL